MSRIELRRSIDGDTTAWVDGEKLEGVKIIETRDKPGDKSVRITLEAASVEMSLG
jgi:hypothetical protein